MAYSLIRTQALPLKAASDIAAFDLVQLDSVANQVKQCASYNLRPVGAVDATVARTGGVAIHTTGDVVTLVCGASVGPGVEVAVATRGIATAVQGPSSLATIAQLGPAAASAAIASGLTAWAVGQSLESGLAGQPFAVLLHPRQLTNLA